MNLADYKEQVRRIPHGKRLPGAVYVHRAGLADLGGSLGALLDQIVARYQISAEFNLVKFRTNELKISFLGYRSRFSAGSTSSTIRPDGPCAIRVI